MLCLIFVLTLSCAYGNPPHHFYHPAPAPACPSCPECPSPQVCPSVTGANQTEATKAAEDEVTNLSSRNGWKLAVDVQGKVYGVPTGNRSGTGWDSDGVLQIISRGKFHQIKGLKANLYIAMNDQGVVYAASDKEDEDTLWEQIGKRWRQYKWHGNDKGWYLAFQNNGRTKNGNRTGERESNRISAQFELIRPERRSGGRPATTKPKTEEVEQMPGDQLILVNNGNLRRLAVSQDRGVHTEDQLNDRSNTSVFLVFWRRHRSQVQLQGKMSGLYVAMNDNGIVYAEPDRRKINTWWKITHEGDELDGRFEWLGNDKGWFLGVDENGELKRGNETQKGQEDARFVIFKVYVPKNKKKKLRRFK